ncbi:LysR family transcriptional regulator (chromosome initiation inhibitor) [Microbacterium phyllosphaerae]|uniref:LysR family transcriptional regulator (Chromosome initiation inhibitor) n=1 Tax=Microbacterium phyllosphaerae TaxID=124798 RepID=A0ABS4WTU0_9MICO|nr:LysR family transcriptional regulator ArgP [Microbacterium phyllosphaerae]MBP2379633.1 LysR family transcriptional regulator (chromosome initiation inhibitor) [Microbacterium phyllosphaerae]
MKIDPELAATVAAVADEGTLDAASRLLQVTPSAVSQRLKALEEQLGRVLVVRSKPARLTEAGEAVVRLARQIALLEHDALGELGLESERTTRTRIPLAVNADSMATWFLPPLARLSAAHDLDFDLHRDDQNFTARLLESGTVMAAVTSESAPVAGCSVSALGVLEYHAMGEAAFVERWFPRGVTRDALEAAPFVDFDRRDTLQHEWLTAMGVTPQGVPRHYVPASHDYALAVRLGLGWGMMPLLQQSDHQLVSLGGPPLRVRLYWQQWNLRSRVLDTIADEVAAEARRVLAH